ncbi:N-6 DNA methylase [Glycomyces sp. NPDC047369]
MDAVEVTSADIARLAQVRPTAVSNWRRRHDDFPKPVGGTEKSPRFLLAEVQDWLERQGKQVDVPARTTLRHAVSAAAEARPLDEVLRNLLLGLRDAAHREPADPEAWTIRLEASRADLLDAYPGLIGDLDPADVDDAQAAMLNAAVEAAADTAPADLAETMYRTFTQTRLRAGDAATPTELAELMVELADPGDGPLLDPACGAGTILLAAVRRGCRSVLGQEKRRARAELAALRFATAEAGLGVRADFHVGNAIWSGYFGDANCAAVVTHPPFNDRTWSESEVADPHDWPYGVPTNRESELAWVQRALRNLLPQGIAVLVMPPSAANRPSGRRIRRSLVSAGVVRAVIALPRGSLHGTALAPHLWIVQPESANPRKRILMADCSTWVDGRHGPQWDRIRDQVVPDWLAFREDETASTGESVFTVRTIDILDEHADLTPARHRPLSAAEPASAADLRRGRDDIGVALKTLLDRISSLPDQVDPESEPPRWESIESLEQYGDLHLHRGPAPARTAEGPTRTVRLAFARPSRRRTDGEAVAEADADHPLVEVRQGDLLVSVVGSRISVRVAEPEDYGAVPARGTVLVRTDPRRIDPEYLAGFLKSGVARQQLSPSTTSMGTNTVRELRGIRVKLPPIERQRLRADLFGRLREIETGLLETADLARELTEEYRLSALIQDEGTDFGGGRSIPPLASSR